MSAERVALDAVLDYANGLEEANSTLRGNLSASECRVSELCGELAQARETRIQAESMDENVRENDIIKSYETQLQNLREEVALLRLEKSNLVARVWPSKVEQTEHNAKSRDHGINLESFEATLMGKLRTVELIGMTGNMLKVQAVGGDHTIGVIQLQHVADHSRARVAEYIKTITEDK